MKRLANLLLLLGALALSVVVCEGGFRLYEQLFLVRQKPVTDEVVDLAALNYNNPEPVPRSKPEGEFRILSFGDSFAYGITRPEFTYHTVAAATLHELLPQHDFRIVNLGDPGTSFFQYLKGYRFWGGLLEHDGVVFNIYLGNDLLDVAYSNISEDVGLNRIGELDFDARTGLMRKRVPEKYPLRMLDYIHAYIKMWRGETRPAAGIDLDSYLLIAFNLPEQKYYRHALFQLENSDPDKLPALLEGYRTLIWFLQEVAAIRRDGKQVMIMLTPGEVQVDRELQQEVERRFNVDMAEFDTQLAPYLIRTAAHRIDPDMPLLDLLPHFACAQSTGEDLYFEANTHLTVQGDGLAGRLLGRALAREWFGKPSGLSDSKPCGVESDQGSGARDKKALRSGLEQDFLEPVLEGRMPKTGMAHQTSRLGKLKELKGGPQFAVGRINNQPYSQSNGVFAYKEMFSIFGWAADPRADGAGGGVVVEIDGVDFEALYGLKRGDVAEHFKSDDYFATGFRLQLAGQRVGRGEHVMRIKVVTQDREAYLASGPVRFTLE